MPLKFSLLIVYFVKTIFYHQLFSVSWDLSIVACTIPTEVKKVVF